MELTKAIEILFLYLRDNTTYNSQDLEDAIALGVHAIDAIEKLRQGTPNLNLSILPGETPPETLLHPTRTFIGNRP